MASPQLTVRAVLLISSAALLTAADDSSAQLQVGPTAAAPLRADPDAEGIEGITATAGDAVDGDGQTGETSARFFFKKARRQNQRYYPAYDYNYYNYNYDYNNNNGWNYDYGQCNQCGYGAVDYTTARRCCQQGYSRCCFEDNNSEKAGTCPPFVYGSSGVAGTSYCRQECSRDSDCYGAYKCCQQGCSRTCVAPRGSTGYDKPGTCPYPGSTGTGYPSYPYYAGGSAGTVGGAYCRRDCYSDQQCPGSQKCCEANCSATCVTPQRYY